nr:serine/threonine-protein kinase 10-A-like [Ciona intestinalis]|eukprot:XP_002122841.1 serine/threonine-protein kinase 10-A-like [Ciona intestinalis]
MDIGNVTYIEEEYELEFASNFVPANDIRGTLWYPRNERPLTSNLMREVPAHKVQAVLECGGLSAAVCYGLHKINPQIHTFEFREVAPNVMGFKIRIPQKEAKHLRREIVAGQLMPNLEIELKKIAEMQGSKFVGYSNASIENCERRLSPPEIRKQKKRQEATNGPAYFEPGEVYTKSDSKGFLGKGACGVVLKAYHHDIGVIAVKCMENHLPQNEKKCRERFDGEAKMLFKLSHSNVVAFFGITGWQGAFGLLMEYLSGGNLSSLCRKGKSTRSLYFPWPLRLRIIKDIASGLAYLHSKKIVHGDMKPANVLLDRELRAKIADFGGAEIAATSGTTSSKVKRESAGKHQYTLIYAAPEFFQAIFSRKRKTPEDVYSLAIIIYEVLIRGKACEDLNGGVSMFKEAVTSGQRPDLKEVEEIKDETVKPSNDHNIITFLEEVMISSWNGQPKRRPRMQNIEEQTNNFWGNQNSQSVHNMAKELYTALSYNKDVAKASWVKLEKLRSPDFSIKSDESDPMEESKTVENAKFNGAQYSPPPQRNEEKQHRAKNKPAKSSTPKPNNEKQEQHDSTYFSASQSSTYPTLETGSIDEMLRSLSLSDDSERYWKEKKYDMALDLFLDMLRNSANDADALLVNGLKAAHCLYALGRSKEGDAQLQLALSGATDYARFRNCRMVAQNVLQVTKKYFETSQSVRGVLIMQYCVRLYTVLPRKEAAVEGLYKCTEVVRKGYKYQYNRHDHVLSLFDKMTSILQQREYLDSAPVLAGAALHGIAYICDDLHHFERAVKLYEKVFEILKKTDPQSTMAMALRAQCLHNCGISYMKTGQFKDAKKLFEDALEFEKYTNYHDDPASREKSVEKTKKMLNEVLLKMSYPPS